MRLGIFAKTFPGTDAMTVLAAVRAAGYVCTQFNMACVGLPPMPDDIPAKVLDDIAKASAATGVEIAALSGTYNMIHPDPSVRAEGSRRLGVMIEAARELGVPLVTLCTGSRDADDMWRYHSDNATPEAWSDMLAEMEKALVLAEAAGVDLGIEPEQTNTVTGAADALKLIGTFGSPHIQIVLDPANLFEWADREIAREIVAAAVKGLAGHIGMAHAKDRAEDGSFTTVGRGVVDFPDFIAQLRAAGFNGPLVTHGLTAEEAPGVAGFLTGLLER